jgi:hypothetical protein
VNRRHPSATETLRMRRYTARSTAFLWRYDVNYDPELPARAGAETLENIFHSGINEFRLRLIARCDRLPREVITLTYVITHPLQWR